MSDVSPVLSAEEAAQVCGVSPKTVGRWVKSGHLKADKRGPSFQIQRSALAPFMGQDSAQSDHPNGTVDIVDNGQDSHTGQLVPAVLYRELQVEMVRKAEAAAMWQARAEWLAAELNHAKEQLALKAPRTTPEDARLSPTATRRWWPFWSLLIAAIATVAGLVVLSGLLIPSV